MFERFTSEARQVLVHAQHAAKEYGHNYIGTEHILLGLVIADAESGLGLFEAIGAPHDQVRAEMVKLFEELNLTGEQLTPEQPPFTPRAKKVLELSLREALQRGENFIGPQHVLLGLLREGEGLGHMALERCGVTHAAANEALAPEPSGSRWPFGKMRVGRRTIVGGQGVVPVDIAHHLSPATKDVWNRANEQRGGRLNLGDPIRTDHLLLAMLEDPDSLASRVLASLDVTDEKVAAALKKVEVAGTTDEAVDPVEVRIGNETVRIENPELRAKLVELLEEQRKKKE